MHPTMYYPVNTKTNYQVGQRPQVPIYNPSHITFTPSSPRASHQSYRIEQKHHSHNLSLNNAKNIPIHSPNDPKLSALQNSMKPYRTQNQKNFVYPHEQVQSGSRFGDMKSSYIGPDARQIAYIKDKQLITQNIKIPRKPPRASQPGIFSQNDTNQTNKSLNQSVQQISFTKHKAENQLLKAKVLSPTMAINSHKKLDPTQRAIMRKSSFDITQSWIKPVWRKKVQKKFSLHDFQKIKQLGTGKYGKVFLVKQKQSQFICALKIIQKQMLKQQQITEQFIRQLKIQLFLNHPNIIRMYGYFQDTMNIYIIMEVALGGQLYKQLKKGVPLSQPRIALIMRQVVSAVNELHSNNIIHRDIKPQNIVLNQNIVKLCDFGWSVYHGQSLRSTFCGTPLYVSPQILKGNSYDQKIDIWSLGIMMYQMLTGQNPFKITQQEELIKIIKESVNFPTYVTISNQAKDFTLCCLQKNPADRKNIRQLMNHQFFKKYPQKSSDKKDKEKIQP